MIQPLRMPVAQPIRQNTDVDRTLSSRLCGGKKRTPTVSDRGNYFADADSLSRGERDMRASFADSASADSFFCVSAPPLG
jgi:hypothetical protein